VRSVLLLAVLAALFALPRGQPPASPYLVTIVANEVPPPVGLYQPPMSVPAGATVTWRNQDSTPHTVTADDYSFDSGLLGASATWSHRFSSPGRYPYHDTLHQDTRGLVIVSAAGSTSQSAAPPLDSRLSLVADGASSSWPTPGRDQLGSGPLALLGPDPVVYRDPSTGLLAAFPKGWKVYGSLSLQRDGSWQGLWLEAPNSGFAPALLAQVTVAIWPLRPGEDLAAARARLQASLVGRQIVRSLTWETVAGAPALVERDEGQFTDTIPQTAIGVCWRRGSLQGRPVVLAAAMSGFAFNADRWYAVAETVAGTLRLPPG
jgi:hypothetical protein